MADEISSHASIEVGQIWDAPSWPAAGSRVVVLERLSGQRWLVWSELGNRIVESSELLAQYASVGVSLRPSELLQLPQFAVRPPPPRGGLDSSP
jgi:hypothetical protein